MNTRDREQAEEERAKLKTQVVLYEAYKKLVRTPEFRLVIENYFLKGYLVESLESLQKASRYCNKEEQEIEDTQTKTLLSGLKVFRRFMNDMETKGELALKDYTLLSEALDGDR
jgi:hypothetical protein